MIGCLSLAAVGAVGAMCVLATACDRVEPGSSSSTLAATLPVEGAWRVAEHVVTGTSPVMALDPPSVFVFSKAHYSMMYVIGGQPRARFAGVNPASQEKVAAYDSFIANAGSYDLAGTTLTVRPIVAKHPNFIGGGFDTYTVRRSGDTLWLAGKSTNIRFRVGDAMVADAGPVTETTLKLVLLEPAQP